MVIHDTFHDFLLFMYVHIAHSDNTYDPREIAAIKTKMSKLFPEGTDIERTLYKAIREYNNFDHAKISELLHDSFAYFSSDESTTKSKVFADMKAIIKADGKILPTEKEAYHTIKRIFDHYC